MPTTLFSERRISELDYAARQLFNRVNEHFQFPITQDEAYGLVINPEDMEVIRRATALCNPKGQASTYSVKFLFDVKDESIDTRAHLGINFQSGYRLLLPQYAEDRIPSFPGSTDLARRLNAFMAERIRRGIEWGRVRDALHWVNRNCDTPSQAAFYFPGIVTLMTNADDERIVKAADKLRAIKTPQKLLMLPRALKEALSQASATVAMAQLMPEQKAPTPEYRITLYDARVRVTSIFDPHADATVL